MATVERWVLDRSQAQQEVVLSFDNDAFISYAHLDNQELIEGKEGWVSNFDRALRIRLGQLLGKEPQIWRDPKLQGNDLFEETLVARLRQVAVLVTILSPRYVKSEWTRRELTEFWKAAAASGGLQVGDFSRQGAHKRVVRTDSLRSPNRSIHRHAAGQAACSGHKPGGVSRSGSSAGPVTPNR